MDIQCRARGTAIDSCNTITGKPTGTPRSIIPQLVNPALTKSVPTHRWWGSVPFVGEMKIDDARDAAYITPDPIRARISNRGVRVSGIPGGLKPLVTSLGTRVLFHLWRFLRAWP